MKKIFLLIFLVLSSSLIYSQNFSVHYFEPGEVIVNSAQWGNDFLISSTEPMGRMSGVEKANGNIYVSVPDTNIFPGQGFGIIIFVSTNHGANWSSLVGIHPAFICPKTKMVRTGLDSVLCFFSFGTSVYNWNVLNGRLNSIGSNIFINYDVAATSTGGLYVFGQTVGTTTIPRLGSADGGITFPNIGTVTTTGAIPQLSKSFSGDTIYLNYYGPVLADTLTSVLRLARYRETATGLISSVNFLDVITGIAPKLEIATIGYNSVVWLFNTTGLTGSLDINCRVSTDNGLTFGAPFVVAGGVTNVDEYWMSANLHLAFGGGVDLIYYRDSLQAGSPGINSDKIMYRWAATATPSTFNAASQVSNTNFPGWSSRLYIPTAIELYSTTDLGAIWVGTNGANKRLYFNRMNAAVGISNNDIVPSKYILSQNYTNPFNQSTNINFEIPKNEFVTLKVFDNLGKEIQTLVSGEIKAGSYNYTFYAANISSGVYYYKITAGNFAAVKKMILIK